jgi:hypothetical protein
VILLVVLSWTATTAFAESAKGTFRTQGEAIEVGFSIAETDESTGELRVLLAEGPISLEGIDVSLDRLEKAAERANDRYVILTWMPDMQCVNASYRIVNAQGGGVAGGGGCYEATFEVADDLVSGTAGQDEWDLSFEAGHLPARQKVRDLPADGEAPGVVLAAQLEAVASGDVGTVLSTLSPEQREAFDAMSEEEREEAIEMMVELAPELVEMHGGALYDGYAILEFEATQFEETGSGRALLESSGDSWVVTLVSCCG